MSIVSLVVDLIMLSFAIYYAVKYHKYKNMAELEFINYENRLEEEISKRQEENYMHESQLHLYKEESGQLKPDIEGAKIENEKFKKDITVDNSTGGDIDKVVAKIEELFREKESEREKRFEAEKQASLAIRKTEEVNEKIEGFKKIHNENVTMIKSIANGLYKKLSQEIKAKN